MFSIREGGFIDLAHLSRTYLVFYRLFDGGALFDLRFMVFRSAFFGSSTSSLFIAEKQTGIHWDEQYSSALGGEGQTMSQVLKPVVLSSTTIRRIKDHKGATDCFL